MQKTLLCTAAAIAVSAGSFQTNAGVDPTKYDDFEGLTCTNVWTISRNLNGEEFNSTEFAKLSNKIRSSIVVGDHIIYAYSKTMVPEGSEESNDYAHLIFHNLYTGEFEKLVQITVNGNPLSGLLCANQIGVDDFGNVWLTGLLGNSDTMPFKLYHITDIDAGTAVLAAELQVPEEEASANGRRHDYSDLVGDITGKQAGTVFMSPAARDAECTVVGFQREQGSDTWTAKMDDGEYFVGMMSETYPAEQSNWDGAPMVRIVRDDSHSGEIFYIDAFVTAPTLYNTSGTMLNSFAEASDLAPKANANGCVEFSIDDKDFLVYTVADYDTGEGSQVRVARLGEGQSFEGMAAAWDLPKIGLGTISDSGTRMFGMNPVLRSDNSGKQAIYLALAKCNNGMAVYRIAQPGFNANDVESNGSGSITDIMADDSEASPIYFTPAGIRVDDNALTPGIYIVRKGNSVAKTVIR